jgi:hypothetical protein
MLDLTRQCQPPQKVAQVVRQGKQLQPRLVVLERAAGKLRPFDGVLAFLDPLLSVPIIILYASFDRDELTIAEAFEFVNAK